jgi:hypothetical protein
MSITLAVIREEAYPHLSPMPFPEIWKFRSAAESARASQRRAPGEACSTCRHGQYHATVGWSHQDTSEITTTNAQSSQFTGNFPAHRGHICAFFNSMDEQHRVLQPYIKNGFDQQDKAYHIVDPEQREEPLRWLAEAVSMCERQ